MDLDDGGRGCRGHDGPEVFEGAGLVLLVAMIGAIVLTHRARGGVRTQNVMRQNMRRPQDAIRNVNAPVGQGVEL